jgi:succinoglycan biosynthesis protein ExoO
LSSSAPAGALSSAIQLTIAFDRTELMTVQPDVTVIIPVYNSASTLRRAIDSVLQQTLTNLEVLIVDDGSRDGASAVAQTAMLEDSRIYLIKFEENGGKAKAMNHAASIAKGRWLAVLDADDRYLPTRLAAMVAAGDSHEVDLVADNQLHLDSATGKLVRQAFKAEGPGREVGMSDFIAHSDTGGTFDFGILKPMLCAGFVQDHALLYHPDAKLAEDFYYLVDFFAAGGRAWLVHEPLYEWTLPFSPTTRRWTNTGAGAWRYDYRNAINTNTHFQAKLGASAPPALRRLLQQRERDYRVMIPYLDAQRWLSDEKSPLRAVAIIASHPLTWPLLIRRIAGRLSRSMRAA